MTDPAKIPSMMADKVRRFLPMMSPEMTLDDYRDHVFFDIVMVIFDQLKDMGVAGDLVDMGDEDDGPVFEAECKLDLTSFPYSDSTTKFVARTFGDMAIIKIEQISAEYNNEIYLANFDMFSDDYESSIDGLVRYVCMSMKQTEESVEAINKWFFGLTVGEETESRQEERWKPREGETYVYVDESLDVIVGEFSSSNPDDVARVSLNNCFEDANDALKAIAKARREEK